MIRLGVCTSIDHAACLKKAGFDYIELSLSSIAALSDEKFEDLYREVQESPLPVESANSMMPGTYQICRKEGLGDDVVKYLEKAFDRAAKLGAKVIVFGAGAARRVPEGMSMEEGLDCLEAFLIRAGALAEEKGLMIAVEPLRAAETNVIHYVREAQAMAARVNRPNVGALADLYHMMSGNDSYEDMKNGLIHCHIAERQERTWPRAGDGSEADYEAFFGALKASGFNGRVSIEGKAPEDFMKEAKESFQLLDELRK